jgi:hypothetical protein
LGKVKEGLKQIIGKRFKEEGGGGSSSSSSSGAKEGVIVGEVVEGIIGGQ